MSSYVAHNFLASVVSSPRGQAILNGETYRRYGTIVRSTMAIGGVADTIPKRISYEIGRHYGTSREALAQPPDNVVRGDATYPTDNVLAEDFIGLARKYTNFSSTFAYSNLAGVAERLARGLASYSVYGEGSTTTLRAGNELTIHALATYDGPVNSLSSTVFIPRLVNSLVTGDAFSVLAAAVCGEGGSVATDILELDTATRRPIIAVVEGANFVRGCVAALRIVGANMIASDQGPLFALAVTRGVHAVVSVVSHTDEGGVHRDLLRCGGFGVPFGGIHYSLHEYAGLPALSSGSMTEVAAYVDSIALVTAALVAHSDPGIEYDGAWYPTFFNGTVSADGVGESGSNLAGTADMAARNRNALLGMYPSFLQIYVAGLGRVFGADGETATAVRFQSAMGQALVGPNNRHLTFPTITPHFWIEPTSLIPSDYLSSPAETEGFASLGGRNATSTKRAWEAVEEMGIPQAMRTSYVVQMRSARTAWFLHHLNQHPSGGLAFVHVRQADVEAIVQPGAGSNNRTTREKLMRSDPLSEYLWTRGQSPFCAPGELINLKQTYGLSVHHATFTEDEDIAMAQVPNAAEFLNSQVTLTIGMPTGLVNGTSNSPAAQVRRARTAASRALASAIERVRVFGSAGIGEIGISMSAPALTKRVAESTVDHMGNARRALEIGLQEAPPTQRPAAVDRNAGAVAVTAHHGAVTAPQPARGGAGPAGGGAAAPRQPPPGRALQPEAIPAPDAPAPPAALAQPPPPPHVAGLRGDWPPHMVAAALNAEQQFLPGAAPPNGPNAQ